MPPTSSIVGNAKCNNNDHNKVDYESSKRPLTLRRRCALWEVPVDILYSVLSHLHIQETLLFLSTCQHTYKALSSTSSYVSMYLLWVEYFIRHCPVSPDDFWLWCERTNISMIANASTANGMMHNNSISSRLLHAYIKAKRLNLKG
jgi:hypothetical protein